MRTKAPTADPFYASSAWRNVRKIVLTRDHGFCVICRKTMPRMQVDHIKPRKQFPHLALDLNNLRTLCPYCHSKADTSLGRSADYKARPFIGADGFPKDSEWT
jgi:5-methylcytosine-specific restriction endonuclease McrA